MKTSEFFAEAKMLQEWMEDRSYPDMPIEIFDKRGELIDAFRFGIDIDRDVIEISE